MDVNTLNKIMRKHLMRFDLTSSRQVILCLRSIVWMNLTLEWFLVLFYAYSLVLIEFSNNLQFFMTSRKCGQTKNDQNIGITSHRLSITRSVFSHVLNADYIIYQTMPLVFVVSPVLARNFNKIAKLAIETITWRTWLRPSFHERYSIHSWIRASSFHYGNAKIAFLMWQVQIDRK